MGSLKAYAPRDNKYVEAKNKLVNNAENFYKGEKKLLKGLKIEYFQFIMVIVKMKKMKKMKKINKKNKKKNKKKNQKKANFSNILRINQKVLAIFF